LAKHLELPEISYLLLEADTLEAVDGKLEEVQKEILDGREKVKKLQSTNADYASSFWTSSSIPSTVTYILHFHSTF